VVSAGLVGDDEDEDDDEGEEKYRASHRARSTPDTDNKGSTISGRDSGEALDELVA
jgi:hypothetical protein